MDKYSHMLGAYSVESDPHAIECLRKFKSLHAPHVADRTAFEQSNCTVITDGDKNAFKEEFKEQARQLGFNHTESTPGRPTENSLAELCVRDVVRSVRAILHSTRASKSELLSG